MRRPILLLAAVALTLFVASGVALAVNKVGTQGRDFLKDTNGADNLMGAGDIDRIFGLAGNDNLIGGPGKDTIFGGQDSAGPCKGVNGRLAHDHVFYKYGRFASVDNTGRFIDDGHYELPNDHTIVLSPCSSRDCPSIGCARPTTGAITSTDA